MSRTQNPLHFEDLSPARFESLSLDLLWSFRAFSQIHSYGQSGSDGGADILAVEDEDDRELHWHVQCKRVSQISRAAINEMVAKLKANYERRDRLLVVAACNISRAMHQHLQSRASSAGYSQTLVWDRSYLEALLYAERRDLLTKYFGDSGNPISEEELLKRRVSLKSELRARMLAKFDPTLPLVGPHRFEYSSIILHALSADTSEFVEDDVGRKNRFGWYSIKKTEPYHLHDDGLSLVFDIRTIYFNDKQWSLLNRDELPGSANVMLIGELDYDNMVQVDFETDDFRPAIHCRYNGPNGPFSAIRVKLLDEDQARLGTQFFDSRTELT